MKPVGYTLLSGMPKLKLSENRKTTLTGLLLAVGSLVIHGIPFLLFGSHPLGYDTGFYRRYLIEPFVSFPNTAVPGLGDDALLPRVILDLLRTIPIPTDIILYGTYFIFWALMPVLLFLFLKPFIQRRGAFIAGILLVCSSLAYTGYWYFLFKNALALDLILLAFIAIERKWFPVWIALDLAIVLTHKTSAIIYLLTLATLFIVSPTQRKHYLTHLAITGFLFILINAPTVRELGTVLPSAVFVDWKTFSLLSLPLFIVIVLGLRAFRHYTIPKTLLAFSAVTLLFPIFKLPFYERIFLFADVALVALAAYGINFSLTYRASEKSVRHRLFVFLILSLAGGLYMGNLWREVTTTSPLVSDTDIEVIETIGGLVPSDATILTTSDEAPWFEGWTRSHIAAPGMLNDNHNLEEWTTFWNSTSTTERIKFLNDFDTPLYISTLGDETNLAGTLPECAQEVLPHLWYVACEKIK